MTTQLQERIAEIARNHELIDMDGGGPHYVSALKALATDPVLREELERPLRGRIAGLEADRDKERAAVERRIESLVMEYGRKADRLRSELLALQAQVVKMPVDILSEIERATGKFPTWPSDPLHALAVLGEEFGELTKEVVQLTYEPSKSSKESVRKEAIQTAAMAVRFVLSLNVYRYEPGEQHSQNADLGATNPKQPQ